jgi:hypothetical protein
VRSLEIQGRSPRNGARTQWAARLDSSDRRSTVRNREQAVFQLRWGILQKPARGAAVTCRGVGHTATGMSCTWGWARARAGSECSALARTAAPVGVTGAMNQAVRRAACARPISASRRP